MLTLLFAAAVAAPTGWKVTNTDHEGCELALGPAESDGTVPMRAECHWKDVSLDTFKAKFADWAGHAAIFTSVVTSRVQRSGDKALVFQEHQASGVSNREILLWMWHEQVDGFDRYAWKTASEEALTPADGHVRADRSDGYWQAKAEGSGVHLVHMLAYDPGGSVPGFLVRWFQTGGLEANVSEARAALTK
jgi:hypothetical protein